MLKIFYVTDQVPILVCDTVNIRRNYKNRLGKTEITRISLCSCEIHRDVPASVFQVLGLRLCTITPSFAELFIIAKKWNSTENAHKENVVHIQ